MTNQKGSAIGCLAIIFVVVAGCNGLSGGTDDDASSALGRSREVQLSPVQVIDAECHSNDTVYDGDDTCHKGGELVTVKPAVDGDTLELTDGRLIRMLGIDAPEPDMCAGPGATQYVRSRVEGRQVKIIQEPGVDKVKDEFLRYVQHPDPESKRTPLIYSQDLGNDVVLYGWGKPYENGANPKYMEGINRAFGIAEYSPEGMFADPCGKPKVYGDDDGNGKPDWEDVDTHPGDGHVNLPDGALTGGYCARKWWC